MRNTERPQGDLPRLRKRDVILKEGMHLVDGIGVKIIYMNLILISADMVGIKKSQNENAKPVLRGSASPDIYDTSPLVVSEETKLKLVLENQSLQNHLHSMEDQLRDVESQIAIISNATSLLAENVESQAADLETIFALAEESHAHISRGTKNLQIVKATSRDLRLFVLVLLIFLSVSLLFLHWFQ